MKMRVMSLEEHENPCGARTAPCDICGTYVPRKRMKIHKSAEHGINPLTGLPFTAGPGSGMTAPFTKPDDFGNRALGSGDALQSVLAASQQDAKAQQDAALLAAIEASKAHGGPQQAASRSPRPEEEEKAPATDAWADDGDDAWGDDDNGDEDGWGDTGFTNPTTDSSWTAAPRPKPNDGGPVAPLWSQMDREDQERHARKKPRTGMQRVSFNDGGPTRAKNSYMEQKALRDAIQASLKTDDAPKHHEFPCPYCSEFVALTKDYTEHISNCAAKTGF